MLKPRLTLNRHYTEQRVVSVMASLRQLGGRPTSPFTSLPKEIGRLSGPRVFVALRGIEHLAPGSLRRLCPVRGDRQATVPR